MTFDNAELRLQAFGAADHLDTPEAQAEYLAAAFETSDRSYIGKALSTVARARGIARTAHSVDARYQGLHKSLSDDGDPRLSTLLAILQSLDVRIRIQVANQASE